MSPAGAPGPDHGCASAFSLHSWPSHFSLTSHVSPRSHYRLPWAVNCTVAQPGSCRLLLTVGDDPAALLYDAASGRQVAQLQGHLDYSFAAAWHPDGHVVATGNQDMTTRLWDLRYPAASLALLKAHIGAVRSLRFRWACDALPVVCACKSLCSVSAI